MRHLLLLAAVLALAACGTGAAEDGPDVSGEWQLRAGTAGGAALPQPPGSTATVEFTEDRASGVAFCNRFFAPYELDGSSLSVGDVGSTMMACEPDVMAAESAYLTALAAVDTAAVDGAELVLSGEGVELRFGPVPTVPDSPLADTRWVLESLVDGETASSVQGEPTLHLGAEGTAEFTTSCNGTAGNWRLDGDRVTVEAGVSTLVGCDPSAQIQDEQVVAVLTAGATVAIDGDRLTLTTPDGRGLVYRAEG